MALWGKDDNTTTSATGVVTVTSSTGVVQGHNTTFTSFEAGQVLTVGVGMTSGFGVIKSITDSTNMQLETDGLNSLDPNGVTVNGSDDAYIVGDRPRYMTGDPEFAPTSANAERGYTSKVYGVNESIQQARSAASSQFTAAHAGWVGVQTYIDCHGTLRVKTETLVAMSGITTNTQATGAVLPE